MYCCYWTIRKENFGFLSKIMNWQIIIIFFYSLLFRDASTSLVISHLGSLGVYQKAVYFYCCVVNISFVTDLILWYIWIWWIMVKWTVVVQIQPSICLDYCGKPRKKNSLVVRPRDLNQGPPECESRALPRSHLARWDMFWTWTKMQNYKPRKMELKFGAAGNLERQEI